MDSRPSFETRAKSALLRMRSEIYSRAFRTRRTEKRAEPRAFLVDTLEAAGLRRLLVHRAGGGRIAADRLHRALDRSP
jgi:hypothetical protein